MQKLILRLVWPYIVRYLAKHSVNYLGKWREQKHRLQEAERTATKKVAAATAALEDVSLEDVLPQRGGSPVMPIWYVLAGVLLGGALTMILTKVWRE